MSMINNPPLANIAQVQANWFTQVYTVCFAIQESGTTAQRPTKNLWLGRRYWDATLNKPVYLSAVNPNVWRDSAAVIV